MYVYLVKGSTYSAEAKIRGEIKKYDKTLRNINLKLKQKLAMKELMLNLVN